MELAGPQPELVTDNTTPELIATHLKDFDQLGQQIFHYKPGTAPITDANSPDRPPALIIICSWLYAQSKHIDKYIKAYQDIYPHSSILLLKQDGPDILWRSHHLQMRALTPAVEVVDQTALLAERDGHRPRVLMHIFSNGGAYTATQLADAYSMISKDTEEGDPPALLPVTALVIDSAPSIPGVKEGYIAMFQGLPTSLPGPVKLLGGALLWSFIASATIVGQVLGSEDVIAGTRRKLNERTGAFMQDGLKRMYMYSDTDQLVPWQHVEMHAEEARKVLQVTDSLSRGERVKLEKFHGSKHVNHVSMHAERYWALVKDLWQECKGQ